MKSFYLAALLGLTGFHSTTALSQFIEVRLSYKVVVDSTTGGLPSGFSDNGVDLIVSNMNVRLAQYQRGYRFQRVDPITRVGQINQPTGPSQWFNVDFFDDAGAKGRMETAATANTASKTQYAWNDNAINIYMVNGICGGKCSFPDTGEDILVIGGCSGADSLTHLHEIGHYFGLYHTQGSSCGCVDPTMTGTCHTVPGDDGINDTLPDLSSWDQDAIARWSYNGRNRSQLNAAEQKLVDDTFFNNMSYHGSSCGQGAITDRMTETQRDRWTDKANGNRNLVVGGRTWFVDRANSCLQPAGGSGCTIFGFGGPLPTVTSGINTATAGDIVLIRAGNYNERTTFTKPVTLRATRGNVSIGRL